MQAIDLAGHPRSLVVLVLGPVPGDPVPLAHIGPQRLRLPGHVVGDHRIGGVEDGLGRAEVLLEGHRGGVGERLFELQDVGDVRTPEPVDGLIAVPHHHDVAVLAGQQDGQSVLDGVGVLELVHEDVGEALPVELQDVGVLPEQPDGVEQQVVEVHGVGRHHPPLVLVVDVGDPTVEDGHRRSPVFGRPLLVRLCLADLAQDGAGGQLLRVDVQLAADDLHQPPRIGVVVDGEGSLVAQAVAVGPQDADTGGVEGGHPHPAATGTDQGGHPLAHLVGCLVGEGDGQDLPRRRVAHGDEVGDPPGEDPGLPRSGPGHDQQRGPAVGDRVPLGTGQPLEQFVGGDLAHAAPADIAAASRTGRAAIHGRHSHSMVPGGLDVMSRATRLTPSTSLMILEDRRSSRS